jgi:two-component system phosphate regulon sensor histidine kinase PhoR
MNRLLRRVVFPLALGIVLGALFAFLLGRVLDGAVRERSRRDLAGMLERLSDEFAPDLAGRSDASSRVRLAARQSGTRVTLIASDGRVIADSDVETVKLPTLQNHGARPEIVAARSEGTGFAERRSATVVEPLLYVARRIGSAEAPAGYLRLAIRESDLDAAEAPFRATLDRVSLGAGILVALFVVFGKRRHAVELDRIRAGVADAAEGRRPDGIAGASEETQEVFFALSHFARLVSAEREGSERARLLARTVFEQVPAGLVVVDRTLAVLDANPAALRIFGLPRSPSHPALVDLVRNPSAVALFQQGVLSGAEGQTGAPRTEVIRLDSGPGRERIVELTVCAVPHGDRPAEPAAIAVVNDVTERERTETMRRRFVADVSHELRTPIAAVRAAADSFEPEESLSPDLRRFVDIIRRQASDMEFLVSDLMDLAQIESGTVTLQIGPVALEPLLKEVASGLASAALAREVLIRIAPAPGLTVAADRRRLAQIFRNLMDNAVKFSPPRSTVEVVPEREGDLRILVHVKDRGIGIPRSEQGSIFQRFYRVDPSRAKATPGTGLGLAIVKHLLILHGASVEVQSEPGQGSRFTVSLASAPAPATSTLEESR